MAIAFRAVGAVTKADVSVSGTPQSFATPAGHVSTDWLLWVIVTDDNTGPASTPSGWAVLANYSAGTSAVTPYTGRPHVWMFHRIDGGSLGPSQSCDFSLSTWPAGKGYVLGFIAAYTGVSQTAPVELVQGGTTTATTAAFAHPQVTTATANDWLISVRGVVSDRPSITYTDSVGTDSERVDTFMTQASSPSVSMYDSNAALTAGLQTQRTTTSSDTCTYGSVGVTIAIQPATAAGTVVQAGAAALSFTAKAPSVSAVSGPWAACTAGMPDYRFKIDWAADGSFTTSGDDVTSSEVSEVVGSGLGNLRPGNETSGNGAPVGARGGAARGSGS